MPNPPMTSPAPLTAEEVTRWRVCAKLTLSGAKAAADAAQLPFRPEDVKVAPSADFVLRLLADRERLEARAQAAEAKLAERDDRGTTHGPNCWSWGPRHYACAEARIAALEEEKKSAADILGLLATGWTIIESDGQIITVQAPDDWDEVSEAGDDRREIVFDTIARTALAARDGGEK